MASEDNVVQLESLGDSKLRVLASTLLSRTSLASYLGQSYGGKRDLYEALGYGKTLQFSDYKGRYERQDVARAVVNAYSDACWALKPSVEQDDTEGDTPFEKAWKVLTKEHRLWHYFKRADRIAGIGQYGIILLGLSGTETMIKEVAGGNHKLLYVRPYHQGSVSIKTYEQDHSNPRFGLPLIYDIDIRNEAEMGGTSDSSGRTTSVHHSRIIHIAEGSVENDVLGTPRLQPVFNRIQDLEKVVGGSAEMFWQGAFPGMNFKAPADVDITPQTKAALEDQIEDYVHGLKRYMRLKGIDVEMLSPTVADPSNHVDVLLTLVSVATGIPKRILQGNEQGELASSQDQTQWANRVSERREDFCEASILRPFIDRCMAYGVLPIVDDYNVDWPDLHSPSDADKAAVAEKRTMTLVKYADSPGADSVIPPKMYLTDVMGFSQEDIDRAEEELGQEIGEEDEELAEAERQAKLEGAKARAAAPPGGKPQVAPPQPPKPGEKTPPAATQEVR